ncbi:CsbD family protein [Vagococcus fluvialis]|uniref:CsbD family protein n=1 Tax=Vagococcus fluvialis TaxID=2738 RepID=UPI0014333678|nr:CsbD family protein [Vagococcus fluvialis]NKC60457.1 CsbD family protein [Vagococcus fluvialis]NKD51240.1 CsbD family protein [Vagococcus fluvialis]
MNKKQLIIWGLGSVFGLAVLKKMNEKTTNKDSVKGKVKEVAGSVTRNESLQAEGVVDQILGASKEVLDDVKGSINTVSNTVLGSGKVDRIKGGVKKSAGEMTDNKELEVKGIADEVVGTSKETVSNVKESFNDVVKDTKESIHK